MNAENKTDPTNAAGCSSCNGCKYQNLEPAGWCYMFRDKPETLPCSQHDKFADQRKAMGTLVRKRPDLLALMIMGISN